MHCRIGSLVAKPMTEYFYCPTPRYHELSSPICKEPYHIHWNEFFVIWDSKRRVIPESLFPALSLPSSFLSSIRPYTTHKMPPSPSGTLWTVHKCNTSHSERSH